MRTLIALSLAILAAACGKADPAACREKHDYGACQALCEKGGTDNLVYCYTERADKMVACVDKNEGCDAVCKDWASIESMQKMGDDTADDYYAANIGARVEDVAKKCASLAGGAGAAGGETPPATPLPTTP
jgi:hypothetical protein